MTSEVKDIKAFSGASAPHAWFDVIGHWAAILAIFVIAHHFGSLPVYLASMVVIAGLQHGLINLQHEAWHMLCFKKRALNDGIGAWFYAYSVGMPYYHERYRHLDHHKYFNTTEDPDWITYNNDGRETPAKIWQFFVGRLFGTLLFQSVSSILLKRKARVGSNSKEKRGPSLLQEYMCVAVVQLILLGAFTLSGRFWEYFVLWFIPLVTIAAFFVSFRAFLEHAHPVYEVPESERLYDFNPSFVERFFVSPADFNYHAVHHAYPTIPHFRLKELRSFLNENNIAYPNKQLRGYFTFMNEHNRALRKPACTEREA